MQGLALYPLQWMLHEASERAKLVLNPDVHPYHVIFTGRHEEPKVIDTPHDVVLKMFDMIAHHQSEKKFGLKLNKPFSVMWPVPRKYTKFLTQPPYSEWLRPKVFVHPSAYLLFDVSTDFRLQIYQWEYFQQFLKGRFEVLSRTKEPWWEKHTIECILKEKVASRHLNILVIGQRGIGKENMVRKIFGTANIPVRYLPPLLSPHRALISTSDSLRQTSILRSRSLGTSKSGSTSPTTSIIQPTVIIKLTVILVRPSRNFSMPTKMKMTTPGST